MTTVQYSQDWFGTTAKPIAIVASSPSTAFRKARHCLVISRNARNGSGVSFTPIVTPTQNPRHFAFVSRTRSSRIIAVSNRLIWPNWIVCQTGSSSNDRPVNAASTTIRRSRHCPGSRDQAVSGRLARQISPMQSTEIVVQTTRATPHGTAASGTIAIAANGG